MQALHQHQITVSEYFSIGELQNKTELINGVIYDMVPPGPNHSHTVRELSRLLILSLKDAIVSQEQPLQLLPDNAPQPDIAILKPSVTGYKTSHPEAKDVDVLIEVSDSTFAYDSMDKMKLYAQASIPLYYIVDLHNKTIVKHTEPGKNGYKKIQKCQDIQIKALSVLIPMNQIM
jgi:Uma2 family endonuclease